MPRTASMSVAEAEAAIGPRGQVTVTAENRGLVRKWFVAQGLPALFVGGLSMRELAFAYNDTKGDQFGRLLKKYEEAKEAAGDEGPEQACQANQTFETAPCGNGQANGDAAALLELLRKTIGSSVDANQVRDIVDATIKDKADAIAAELKKSIWPVTRVQLITPSGEAKDVEGPVHPNFPLLLRMAQARDADGYHVNIFLSGEASSGKTTACKQLANALARKWYFNGAISMPHEMLGFIDAAGNYHRTPFRDAYEHGGVYTFDEVDRSDPVALLAVNPHLANGVATFPDGQIKRHKDCLIICTANTWGNGANADYCGATKLDAAFLSRFPARLSWNIDKAFEMSIAGNEAWAQRVQAARAQAQTAGLKVMIDVRMTLAGAALIAFGLSEQEAAEATYLANITPEQRRMIEA
jgi:AAA domain (dynein-related subfamily)